MYLRLKNHHVAIRKQKISQKKYNKAYTTLPTVITNDSGYMWKTGRNKMYTHYTEVQRLNLENGARIPHSRFKQLTEPKNVRFSIRWCYKSELKLIRNRLKQGHINLKGFVTVHKSYCLTHIIEKQPQSHGSLLTNTLSQMFMIL